MCLFRKIASARAAVRSRCSPRDFIVPFPSSIGPGPQHTRREFQIAAVAEARAVVAWPFIRHEAEVIAKTLDGDMPREDSWMTAVPWEELSYPGMPIKPRPKGIIKIEVNIRKRTITTVWEMLHCSMDFQFPEEDVTGNDVDDVVYAARHIIEALKQVNLPQRFVDGDRVEIWQVVEEGENRLLGSLQINVTPSLTRSEFDVLGGDHAN